MVGLVRPQDGDKGMSALDLTPCASQVLWAAERGGRLAAPGPSLGLKLIGMWSGEALFTATK